MKSSTKILINLLISLLVGFLFAGLTTKVTHTCAPVDGAAGCQSFEKAIVSPTDLLNNRQNSLINFSITFVVTLGITYILLWALSRSFVSKHS